MKRFILQSAAVAVAVLSLTGTASAGWKVGGVKIDPPKPPSVNIPKPPLPPPTLPPGPGPFQREVILQAGSGAAVGAATGAATGSILGPAGTVAGAAGGAAVGAVGGAARYTLENHARKKWGMGGK